MSTHLAQVDCLNCRKSHAIDTNGVICPPSKYGKVSYPGHHSWIPPTDWSITRIPVSDDSCKKILKEKGVTDEDLDKLTFAQLEEIAIKLADQFGKRSRAEREK